MLNKTRMTTFIKTKFKISEYQTNIELILQPIIITNFCGSENHLDGKMDHEDLIYS